MTRKHALPQFPEDYKGHKAAQYNNLRWMERNQRETTLQCIKYLFDPNLGPFKYEQLNYSNYLVLDLGCGTGFSTELIVELGFNVIGIDILKDMLIMTHQKQLNSLSNAHSEIILASIRDIPLQPDIFDFIISVSAYNFITYREKNRESIKRILNETARYLYALLKDEGRMVIEFYPSHEQELTLFLNSFIDNHFTGYYIKDDHDQKGGQTYLLLKKEGE
jgi:SAM-dependent methyltransferase